VKCPAVVVVDFEVAEEAVFAAEVDLEAEVSEVEAEVFV
jgi:hypothetical protein